MNKLYEIKIILVVSVLLFGFYYYIYHSNSYIKNNYEDLSANVECNSYFACTEGYRSISYPSHTKIFYDYYFDCQIICSYKSSIVFLEDVDIDSFRVLGRYYAVDKNNLYFRYKIVDSSGLDLNELSVIEGSDFLIKDSKNVLYAGEKIPNADPKSLQLLNVKNDKPTSDEPAVFRSGNKIFVNGTELNLAIRSGKFLSSDREQNLPVSDCVNPKLVNESYYSCNITSTGENELVDIDTETFAFVNSDLTDFGSYVKDKNYVYYLTREVTSSATLYVVEEADPKTFHYEKDNFRYSAFDEANSYLLGCKNAEYYPRRNVYMENPNDHRVSYCWY